MGSAPGDVTFETEAEGDVPLVMRIDVRDGADTLVLSVEMLAERSGHWLAVDVHASQMRRGAHVGWSEGIVLVFHEFPSCSASGAVIRGPGSAVMSVTLDAACLGPQPVSVLAYAVGEDVRSRVLRVRSEGDVSAADAAQGQGGVFAVVDARPDATSAQVSGAVAEAGVLVGELDVRTESGFIGSFALFGWPQAGSTSYEAGTKSAYCPCTFFGDGLSGPTEWTFRAHGAAEDVRDILVAGVDLPR